MAAADGQPCAIRFELVAFVAALLTSIALLSQIVHVVGKQRADQLSFVWLVIALASASLWFAFGAVNGIRVQVISALAVVSLYIALVVVKIYYDRKATQTVEPKEIRRPQ